MFVSGSIFTEGAVGLDGYGVGFRAFVFDGGGSEGVEGRRVELVAGMLCEMLTFELEGYETAVVRSVLL